MGTKRRTEITVETDRVLVIRKHKESVPAWCRECKKTVNMVTPDVAAVMARVSARTIYRLVEAEKLHFQETREGTLLVCRNSLARF